MMKYPVRVSQRMADVCVKAAAAAIVVNYPSVTGSVSATRSKMSSDVSPTPNSGALSFSLYTPQVSVSFVPDVFGLNRRTVESLKAREQQTRFALAATHITLSSNVAAAAIQEASLRGQIDATPELTTISTNMLQILRNQYQAGYASELDVAGQELQLAQVAAALPPLLKQLAQQRDLLTALSGGFPDSVCRHGRAVSGSGRRVVEPCRYSQAVSVPWHPPESRPGILTDPTLTASPRPGRVRTSPHVRRAVSACRPRVWPAAHLPEKNP
jgi:hypothetical protein